MFASPYVQHADMRGQPFRVIRLVDHAFAPDLIDQEPGRMWLIEFACGFRLWAWPEEVERACD